MMNIFFLSILFLEIISLLVNIIEYWSLWDLRLSGPHLKLIFIIISAQDEATFSALQIIIQLAHCPFCAEDMNVPENGQNMYRSYCAY